MSNLNLINLLNMIRQNNLSELRSFLNKNPDIFKTLEILDVITFISSDPSLIVELTPLGLSILINDEIIQSLKQQDNKLNSIHADLQRIKSSLSAISLDTIRSGGLVQENSYTSDFLVQSDRHLQSDSEKKDQPLNTEPSNKNIFTSSYEEFKLYVQQTQKNLDSSDLQKQKKSLKRINDSYSKLFEYLQQENYQEFGLESFLLLDSILIFILQFFDQKDPNILNQPLEKKYNLVKNLPLKIELDLIQFLEKFNSDILTKTKEPLKIGEKTAKKLLGLINDVYKPFISVFEE